MSRSTRRTRPWSGIWFVVPFVTIYLLFMVYPVVMTFIMSLHEWPLLGDSEWIGFDNYVRMVQDPEFWSGLWHTTYFVILSTIPLVLLGMLLALMMDRPFVGRYVFRGIFFAPHVLNVSVVSIIWRWIFQSEFGLLNLALARFGIEKISWLGDAATAMPSIAIATVWWTVGFNMILFLAGLQEIPKELYESADLDGAGSFKQFWYIKAPLLKRTTFLVVILQIIASFKIFGQVYVMTGGGPHGSTRVLVHHIYRTAFRYFEMGYGSALAFALFVIILIISMLQVRYGRRREMA